MPYNYLPGFDYKIFQHTPCWEIAKAIDQDDSAKIIKLIKKERKSVNCFDPKFGTSLLTLAIINNKRGAFEGLLQAGVDVNSRSPKDSSTALYTLCANSDITVNTLFYLARLIEHGADANAGVPDTLEGKPIEVTCLEKLVWTTRGIKEIDYLMSHGVKLDGYPINGKRSLVSIAAILEHFVVLRYLLIVRKFPVPDYCLIQQRGTENERRLSLKETIDLSTSALHDQQEKQAKEDVLNYLASTNY